MFNLCKCELLEFFELKKKVFEFFIINIVLSNT